MKNYFKVFFLVLSYCIGDSNKYLVPAPVTWGSYNLTTNVLTFVYPYYSAGAMYLAQYTNSSASYYLPANSSSIYCSSPDGSQLGISYTVSSGSYISGLSTPATLLCAGLPSKIPIILYTVAMGQITLYWNSSAGNGSPVLGYKVYRSTSTSNALIGTTQASVLTYNDLINSDTTYNYTVFPFNAVGSAVGSYVLSVSISSVPSPFNSAVVQPVTLNAGIGSIFKVNLITSAGNVTLNPSIMILETRDVCSVSTGYECSRVPSTDPNYVPDLLTGFVYTLMTDNKNGTMSASFAPPLAGPYTFSVIQLQPGGLYSNYWDNIWFLPPLDHSSITPELYLSWPEGLITNYSSQYISAKYFAFLYPPYNDSYTFYITAFDNFRLYINGILRLDGWNACCQEFSTTLKLITNNYYFLQIEYRQLDSSPSISLYWSSGRISKQVLPSAYLYWPVRVTGSPWVQYAGVGLSTPLNCYYSGPINLIAGEIGNYKMYSADARGQVIDNPNDVYTITFLGPSRYYFVSNYSGKGVSYSNLILGVSGNYSVSIQLYGKDIKNSPYSMQVFPGSTSAAYSYINYTFSATAGIAQNINVSLFDAFGNGSQECCLSATIVYLNSSGFNSSIGLPDPDRSSFGYNQSGVYSNGVISFTVYVAGFYNVSVYIKDQLLSSYILSAQSSYLYAPNCAFAYLNTQVTAGNYFIILVQARDLYYNNILYNTPDAVSFSATGPYAVQGQVAQSSGTYNCSLLVTASGTYTLSLYIGNNPVSNLPQLNVIQGTLSLTASVITMPTYSISGVAVTATIYTKDVYSNIRPGGDILTYSIIGSSSVAGTLTDLNNGTYSLVFTPYTVGTYTVNVYYNGLLVYNPQVINITNSNVRGIYSQFSSFSQQVFGKGALNITSKDIGGNVVYPVTNTYMGSQYYYAYVKGPQNITIQSTYTNNAYYQINVSNITAPGNYSVALALMEQYGLNGFYFKDTQFQGLYSTLNYHNIIGVSPAYYTSKDSSINFIFNNSPYSYFFSVYWTGNLLINASDNYTFYVQCDNQARLTINGLVLVNTISGSYTQGSTLLSNGIFYPLVLEYINGGYNGYIRLLWSTSTKPQTIIASDYFYSETLSQASPYS